MNCHETRERLSGLLDLALAAPERTEVGAHLEGCPDCRRELDRLRATVSLLSRVERPRAPVGFVDRVTAAARPVPWYQRLGRRLFLPLGIKLPAQAAAMLVIAVLGVYLLQRTPELKDAARVDRETPVPLASRAATAPQVAVSEVPPPASPPVELPAKSRDSAEEQSGALAPPPPAMSARRHSAVSGVFGRLNVKNRPAAEQGLADLLARLGGSETGRRQELGATVVDVLVPEARYADFVRGLTTLGAFTPEGQPAALPTDPPQIRLSIRISD